MPSPTTYALYSLLIMGDGQDVTQQWIPPGGLTSVQCFLQLEAREPSAMVNDRGEAVQTVYGCEQEALNDRESSRAVQGMFEAAAREDMRP